MSDEQDQIATRKDKLKKWLKNPANLLIILLLISAIFIRVYYFSLAKNQPLWWDESEYMAAAKTYAGIGHFELSSLRLPGFPLLASLFFRIGITNEALLRFFLAFIPSLLLIFIVWRTTAEIYTDKRIAIISLVILTVLWENLFYSNRFQTENIALIFEYLAIFFLIKGYTKKEKTLGVSPKFSLMLVALCIIFSIFFRPGNIPFVPALLAFIAITNLGWLTENKKRFTTSLIALVLLIVLAFGSLPFLDKIPLVKDYYKPTQPISWNSLTFFYGLYQSVVQPIPALFFYAFIIGLVLFCIELWAGYPVLKKFKRDGANLNFKSNILGMLIILSVLFTFIFLMRIDSYEFRWFFPLLPGLLPLTAQGILIPSDFVGKLAKNKKIAIVLIIIVVLLGAYTQLFRADPIIKQKISSYAQVRDSGAWIKENSLPTDAIVSASVPQHSYYSERKVYDFNFNNAGSFENESIFLEKIMEKRPRYIVVSVFEPAFTPEWAYTWAERYNQTVRPVQVYYADATNQQPVLVIYGVINYTV